MKIYILLTSLLILSPFIQAHKNIVLKPKDEVCEQLAAYLLGNNPDALLSNKMFPDGSLATKFAYQVKYQDNYGNNLTNTSSITQRDLLSAFKLCIQATPELVEKLEKEIENLQPKS